MCKKIQRGLTPSLGLTSNDSDIRDAVESEWLENSVAEDEMTNQ